MSESEIKKTEQAHREAQEHRRKIEAEVLSLDEQEKDALRRTDAAAIIRIKRRKPEAKTELIEASAYEHEAFNKYFAALEKPVIERFDAAQKEVENAKARRIKRSEELKQELIALDADVNSKEIAFNAIAAEATALRGTLGIAMERFRQEFEKASAA